MKVLFIDTHSENLYIAIKADNKIFDIRKNSNRSHSEIAIPSLIELLEQTRINLKDLDEIIVVNGPGSFTGVRIGVTIAKTIAYSLNIPIKSITALEALGESEKSEFDIIAIRDSKGVYSAKREQNGYVEYCYQKNSDFDNYLMSNNYSVSFNEYIDFEKVLRYVEKKEYVNPHSVNPIYIKEIDALK